MNEIDNKNRICEAWFLFPQNQLGLIRFLCWSAIWLVSIVIVVPESVASLSNAYLVFTLSMMMEFFPSFGKYPKYVTEGNIKLNRSKKIISVCFLLLLTAILLYSCFLVFKKDLPPFHSLANVRTTYFLCYIFVFIYLLVNCIKGMIYTPQATAEELSKLDQMFHAAENGALGNIQAAKR